MERGVPLRRRHQGLRRSTSTPKGSDPRHGRSTSRPRTTRTRLRSRSRCSGTRSTSSRSSRSPTTSTRIEGGTHLSGFRCRADAHDEQVARADGLLKEKEDGLEGEDTREGLAAVISVKLRDPQFEGQTKTKLGNPWVRELRRADGEQEARRVVRGELRPSASASSARRSTPRAPARRRARRARSQPQGRARRAAGCRASSRTASRRPGAVRALPRRGQLGRRVGRSSARQELPGDPAAAREGHQLARRTGSTRCSRTPRSSRSSPRWARGSAPSSTSRSSATTAWSS